MQAVDGGRQPRPRRAGAVSALQPPPRPALAFSTDDGLARGPGRAIGHLRVCEHSGLGLGAATGPAGARDDAMAKD